MIAACLQNWWEGIKALATQPRSRSCWRLAELLWGMLFAAGRRTVTSWLRAAGITHRFAGYYHFIADLGRKAKPFATRLFTLLLRRLPLPERVLVAIDDTPTKRYGPKVQGAGLHHNPTPGPAKAKWVYGHVWTMLALLVRHPRWGTLALPLLSHLYIRQQDLGKLPKNLRWPFQTKLQQACDLLRWAAEILISSGKKGAAVVDGFYVKRPVLKTARELNLPLVGRLRKDAALYDLPPPLKPGQRRGPGRPRKYGTHRIDLGKRAAHPGGWQTVQCVQYGEEVTKTVKSFVATYPPAYGAIRVAIVREEEGPQFFLSLDPNDSPRAILEDAADRGTIEQTIHDVKEVGGAGQQQVRGLWANLGAWHLNLWLHSLVELWAWGKPKEQLCDRSLCPWDDPDRRPSHADRRKALRREILQQEFSATALGHRVPQEIRRFIDKLLVLAG
jgi:hypothetical protein